MFCLCFNDKRRITGVSSLPGWSKRPLSSFRHRRRDEPEAKAGEGLRKPSGGARGNFDSGAVESTPGTDTVGGTYPLTSSLRQCSRHAGDATDALQLGSDVVPHSSTRSMRTARHTPCPHRSPVLYATADTAEPQDAPRWACLLQLILH